MNNNQDQHNHSGNNNKASLTIKITLVVMVVFVLIMFKDWLDNRRLEKFMSNASKNMHHHLDSEDVNEDMGKKLKEHMEETRKQMESIRSQNQNKSQ